MCIYIYIYMEVIYSKLHLVDLAGSERVKKTGTDGVTLKEAQPRPERQEAAVVIALVIHCC